MLQFAFFPFLLAELAYIGHARWRSEQLSASTGLSTPVSLAQAWQDLLQRLFASRKSPNRAIPEQFWLVQHAQLAFLQISMLTAFPFPTSPARSPRAAGWQLLPSLSPPDPVIPERFWPSRPLAAIDVPFRAFGPPCRICAQRPSWQPARRLRPPLPAFDSRTSQFPIGASVPAPEAPRCTTLAQFSPALHVRSSIAPFSTCGPLCWLPGRLRSKR